MSLKLYDLTTSLNKQDQLEGTSSIRVNDVPSNVTYTWIVVRGTATNFISGASAPTRTITNTPAGVQEDAFSKSNAFSSISRLQSSIALPLPKNLPYQWSNDWSMTEDNFGGEFMSSVASGNISSFSDAKDAVASGAKNQLIGALNKSILQKIMQRNVGTVANPFKEIYYNGVGFRSFSFNWEFAPQNESESSRLETLLYELELASHPELIDGPTSAYNIPDVFDISFVGTRLPKIQTAALTGISIDYSPQGPKFFKNGHPAFIEVGLSFTELIPITKKEIRESHLLHNPQILDPGRGT